MAFIEASTDGELNGAAEVEFVSAPSISERKVIRGVTVFNPDSSTVRFTLAVKNAGQLRILQIMDLPQNNSFHWLNDPIILDGTTKSLVGFLDISPSNMPTYYCSLAVIS